MIDVKTFKTAIKKTAPFINEKLNDYKPLRGFLFHVKGNVLRIVGSDNIRLSVFATNLSKNYEDMQIVLPKSEVLNFTKSLNSTDEYVEIGNEGQIKTKNKIIQIKPLDVKYFDYLAIIPTRFKTEIKVSRSEFMDKIKKLKKMNIDELTCFVKNYTFKITGGEKVTETINIIKTENVQEYPFDPNVVLRFVVNLKFLLDAIEVLDGDEVTIKFNQSWKPIGLAGKNTNHLILIATRREV